MWKFLRIVLWTAGILAVLIGVLRLTAIRWWQLPADDRYFDASVSPTLRGGDWVILWRATAPNFGDLVLCPEPKTNRPVIGRIAGEATDHLKIDGSYLTINNAIVRDEGSCDHFREHNPANGLETQQRCDLEVLGGRTHKRGDAPADDTKTTAEFDVPPGQVFLVSDNRGFPWDSRDFGPVERATCAETVIFRLVSKDGFFDVANRLTLIR
jgi:signal peptidase I